MNNKRFFSFNALASKTSPLKLKNAHQKALSFKDKLTKLIIPRLLGLCCQKIEQIIKVQRR